MKPDLPESLHPLASNHPAGCAWRILLSPHEWTWTQAEVEAMARAVVALNTERIALRGRIEDRELIRNDYDYQFSRRVELERECIALREDKARLDWLAEQHRRERQSMSASKVPKNDTAEMVLLIVFDEQLRAGFAEGATFRAAIDAARKEAKP